MAISECRMQITKNADDDPIDPTTVAAAAAAIEISQVVNLDIDMAGSAKP